MPSFRALVLSGHVRLLEHFWFNKRESFATMYRCYVIKQMVNTTAYTIELWMHAGGLLTTQEPRVALATRFLDVFKEETSKMKENVVALIIT